MKQEKRMLPGRQLMQIRLNGETHVLDRLFTVADLLAYYGYAETSVAVAINGEFVPRSAHTDHPIHEGDELDVVAPQAGG